MEICTFSGTGSRRTARPASPTPSARSPGTARRNSATFSRAAAAAGVRPALILTSPYRRAVQTAQLAAEILEYKGDLVRTQGSRTGSTPRAVWEEIRVHKDAAGEFCCPATSRCSAA